MSANPDLARRNFPERELVVFDLTFSAEIETHVLEKQ